MGLSAEISTTPGAEKRNALRRYVRIGAGLRQRGNHRVMVNILDLSTSGFRIESYLDLKVGSEIWLTLPGLASSRACVAWVDNIYTGCRFLDPLHPAVFDMIVRNGSKH